MMFYLADEVRDKNVAVNIMIPGHTRTTGFDEQNLARRESGRASGNAPAPLKPEHMVPLALPRRADGSGGCHRQVFRNGDVEPRAWVGRSASVGGPRGRG